MNYLRTHCSFASWCKSLPLALLLTLGPCGCKDGAHHTAPKEETTEAATAVVKFKAGKGVLLPEETRKAIGLEIVEVNEEKLIPQVTTQAEIYRAANDSAYALALSPVKADVARQINVGQPVNLQPLGDSVPIRGKVIGLDSHGESFLGQTEVLLEVPDATKTYSIGTLFTVTFDVGEAKSVTVVPKSAMLSASEGPFVYVVNGQHFLRTLIKIGGQNKDWIEVVDGLFSGDKIVSRPVETLWMTELRAVKGGGDND